VGLSAITQQVNCTFVRTPTSDPTGDATTIVIIVVLVIFLIVLAVAGVMTMMKRARAKKMIEVEGQGTFKGTTS
jgi:hypothetical protein